MKTADVKKLPPVERFLYWVRERHAIHLRRAAGAAKPWTDDEVLRRYFFTNPYRENDKVTVWFRENVRDPLRSDPRVVFATVCFRWFNYIPTGELLLRHGLLTRWSGRRARRLLGAVRDAGGKVFTGAYLVNSPAGVGKLEGVAARVGRVWARRRWLASRARGWRDAGLRAAHRDLTSFSGLAGFTAYEVVTDLYHTDVLAGAADADTWCNPGPGCLRGLLRLSGVKFDTRRNGVAPPRRRTWLADMTRLLALCRHELDGMPPFRMREVEHSLCEFDKYERALWGDGRLKRVYDGGP